jgi:hypothetical protein
MICFLTINRQVVYIRVLFQPPGGFYPVIIVPPNVSRIKLDSMANRVNTEDFGSEHIKAVLLDAYKQIESEKTLISQGLFIECFIEILISNDCLGGILIVPLNFICSIRKNDIDLRKKFISKYNIITLNIFEEQVFEDTTYTICSFQFETYGKY